jgi:hypothetical protein
MGAFHAVGPDANGVPQFQWEDYPIQKKSPGPVADPNKKIPMLAKEFTTGALGEPIQRIDLKTGNIVDTRYGGFGLSGGAIDKAPVSYPRTFNQAAAESMTVDPEKWQNRSNWPQLAADIVGSTVPQMPPGWSVDPESGKFVQKNLGGGFLQGIPFVGNSIAETVGGQDSLHADTKLEAEAFFRDKIMPQLRGGAVGEMSWAKVKKMAADAKMSRGAMERLGIPVDAIPEPKVAPADNSKY